jgi:patatin-related protein
MNSPADPPEGVSTSDAPDRPGLITDSPAVGTPDTLTEILEHRLALVMNGGVSLAVWMGGVACEIDNVRRASNGMPPPGEATEEEKAVHALWVKATQRARARVTVDVIAGTSAGGLNGVLLGTAIARGASLSGLKNLWVTSGQMSAEALFRPQGGGALSLMNGDFFYQQIVGELEKMAPTPDGRDVSLIVTSTALGPSSRQVRDSKDVTFFEADHRRRFHFSKHAARPCYVPDPHGYQLRDGNPVDDLADDGTLAWAGRASASYPVAFAPVKETPQLRERRVWPDWETSDEPDWLADGGILDNSPFDPVLESIQHKAVTGPWKRTLCFVVPSGAEAALGSDIRRPAPGGAGGQPAEPPPWTSVAAAALSFPREANFRDDIDHLHETIRCGRSSFDVSRFQLLTGTTPGAAGAGTAPKPGKLLAEARDICATVLPLYRQSCRAAAIYQVRDTIVRALPDGYIDPVSEITDAGFNPGTHPWLPGRFPADGDPLPTTWDWGADAADRVVRIMLRSTSSESTRESRPVSSEAGLGELRKDLSRRLHQISAISRAIDEYVESAGKEAASLLDPMVTEILDDAYRKLWAGAELASIVGGAAAAYAVGRLGTRDRAPDVLAAALAVEVSNNAGSLPDDSPRPIFDFARFGLDNPPPLLQDAYDRALASPSPTTSQRPKDPSDILYGTRLNHFAAFADPDWRDWDWMWGRMNALAHLASLLDLDDADVDELTKAILAAENRQLGAVQADIGTVMNLTGEQVWADLRSANRFPAALDALFDFLRSQAPTIPRLNQDLQAVGQFASDLLARSGHQGRISHRVLRVVALIPRRMLWKRAKPSR